MQNQESQKKFENYYLGLDIGTSSVGWAVTDLNYKILRYKGQDMWGVHLFDEASTAADRRKFRTARRRRERQVNRIKLLRELMEKEVLSKDAGFFARLDESKLHIEDRQIKHRYTLFNDSEYTDADYHHEFPTIYHLRLALMNETDRKFDIRLIYLALAHIMKSRGNFLFQGANFELGSSFIALYEDFKSCVQSVLGITLTISEEELKAALKKKGIKQKQEELKILNNKGLAKLLSGGKVKLNEVFSCATDEAFNEDISSRIKEAEDGGIKAECELSATDFNESKAPQLAGILGDEAYLIIEAAKKIYDWSVLAGILNDKSCISAAMVEQAKNHRIQKGILKHLVRKYAPDKENDFFKNTKIENNYQAWIGKSEVKNNNSVCSQKDFYDSVKKLFGKDSPIETDEHWQTIYNQMEVGSFLPKLRVNSNGVIPYQLHSAELKKILQNAEKHYPFFKKKDETGYSVSEKIIKILEFRIPYYVGPLTNKHNADKDENHGHAWIVRNEGFEHVPIRPWNFEQVVNLDACAEAFIRRMTVKCTYLPDCDVLPKESLLYCKYDCLSKINNLKINGQRISQDVKKQIFDLCCQEKTVTAKMIATKLWISRDLLAGFAGDLKLSLKSYHDFKAILGEEQLKLDRTKSFVEKCVEAITCFSEGNTQLESRIRKIAAENNVAITDEQINKIGKLHYKDWGRLSREFLTEIEENGVNIITALESGTENIMELLGNKHGYQKAIDERNSSIVKDKKFTYKNLVRSLYCSPAVKRSIWRTLAIIKDIERVTKQKPLRIFVEMAREEGEKGKQTSSRKNQLLALYKNIKKDADLDNDLAHELNNWDDAQLRAKKDKLYLYFLQNGKCMYTGEKIDLHQLLTDNNIYDIDHIYPQSKTMDNSLDNRVLVKKDLNNDKQDKLPFQCNWITDKARNLWKSLKQSGFISDEKYYRLTRQTPLTAEELAGFVNRQLVETRQATKAVCDTIKQVYENEKTTVVYSQAGRVSEFRKEYKFTKCRELNDFHHAKDAYLNIVVGNVYYTRFTANPAAIFREDRHINMKLHTDNGTGLLDYDVTRFDQKSQKIIEAWSRADTLPMVIRMMDSSRILVTRYVKENHGGFYDQMPLKAKYCNESKIPLKTTQACFDDVKKYGGYDNAKIAYFFLVDHIEKKKHVQTFKALPIRFAAEIEKNPELLERYCIEKAPFGLGLDSPRILLRKLRINSKLVVDGFPFIITGKTNDSFITQHCLQLVLPPKSEAYFKKVIKSANNNVLLASISKEENEALYELLLRKHSETIYKKRKSSQVEVLNKGKEKFSLLEPLEQCTALKNILLIFSSSRATDLTLIGGSKHAGTMSQSLNITKEKSVLLVRESPTGLTSSTIDLKTLK